MCSADSAQAAAVFPAFPWMDDLTLQFALDGLQSMKLGQGPQTDILAISLSTTDAVGHAFGPDSRELHDQIVRWIAISARSSTRCTSCATRRASSSR